MYVMSRRYMIHIVYMMHVHLFLYGLVVTYSHEHNNYHTHYIQYILIFRPTTWYLFVYLHVYFIFRERTCTHIPFFAFLWRHLLFFHCSCTIDLPKDFVHQIPWRAPRSLECPYGVLSFLFIFFVLGLYKVVKMKAR